MPAAAAAAWTSASTAPASATRLWPAVSTGAIAVMRERLTITASPRGEGVAPPASPVLPPWGTSGTRPAAAAATTAATSAVDRGQTIIAAAPRTRPRQSTRCGASTSAALLQPSPTAARIAS